eukprot:TRINITY_DN83867_c0_g1_i1.p1 TRINITY_DN83867_c0_g1~~TRINITY_DN83867_c0_g1_i1.p1  ORF type:complete len:109 (-),score=9.84 TRINITY_DN83867_c0_g1_i1:90-416(-)
MDIQRIYRIFPLKWLFSTYISLRPFSRVCVDMEHIHRAQVFLVNVTFRKYTRALTENMTLVCDLIKCAQPTFFSLLPHDHGMGNQYSVATFSWRHNTTSTKENHTFQA